MRIFYQYGKYKELTPTRGDFITELCIIKAIKKFAEVSSDESTGQYDLYYIRNNPNLFMRLPSPKVYFASPFDVGAYNDADAIATFTDVWTKRIRDGKAIFGTPGVGPNRNAITIHQVIDDTFKPLQSHEKTRAIRMEIGGDFIIGHFGAVRMSNYPHSFLHILPRLKKKYPGIRVVFAGGRLNPEHQGSVIHKQYEYNDIPYAISACDLTIYSVRIEPGNFGGSMKILESMACGVPVLSPRFEARVDELSKNYELFHPFKINQGRFSNKIEEIMFNKICKIIDDKQLRKKISKRLVKRSKFYSIDESAKRLEKTFRGLL